MSPGCLWYVSTISVDETKICSTYNKAMSKVCRLRTVDLRTAVVHNRRLQGVTGKQPKAKLIDFITMHRKLESFSELESMTHAKLVELRSMLVHKYHPVPRTQSRDNLLAYVYFTANKMGWQWSEVAPNSAQRMHRPCWGSRGPGSYPKAPKALLTRNNRGAKRPPSQYNAHIQTTMLANTDSILTPRERFKHAASVWMQKKRK